MNNYQGIFPEKNVIVSPREFDAQELHDKALTNKVLREQKAYDSMPLDKINELQEMKNKITNKIKELL